MPEKLLSARLDKSVRTLLSRLQHFFKEQNLAAYLVGGFPRDLVLGRRSPDIDIAILGGALSLGEPLAEMLHAKAVILDAKNGVVRFMPREPGTESWQLDVSSAPDGLAADLARRDFTLDAMAIDLSTLQLSPEITTLPIIDPLGGLSDIEKRLVRASGEDVFRQDGIRLLRGVRLASELKFGIEAGTEQLMQRDCLCVRDEAGERIREELLRLLSLTSTDETLLYMEKLGLLTAIFPEMAPSLNLEQHGEHQWDVFEHSIHSVRALDFLLREDTWSYADPSVLEDVPWNDALASHFSARLNSLSTHRVLGKIAAILHDVAKPQTRTISKSGRLRFYGHPEEGAVAAEKIMERLRFSTREKSLVTQIVRYHLRPVQMNQDEELPSRRAVYRFMRDLGEAAIDTLFFSLADHLATRGDHLDLTNWRYHANIVAYVLKESAREAQVLPERLVDGYDLQRELGIAPGVELGNILAELREAQAAGEITSRTEALEHAKRMIKISG